jgi:hypothetical protein
MAEEFLDRHQVDPRHHQVTREGVAQVMEYKAFDTCLLQRTMEAFSNVHEAMPCLAREDIV